MNFKDLLSGNGIIRPDELAEGLKVAQGTVYAWVERGLIPHLRLGKLIRFEAEAVREWIEQKRKPAR